MRDRFRGRITFPIHDLQGRGIAFGARILPTDPRAGESAKYLNSAETPIYRKNEVLYNLHRARSAVAKSGEVFVVEGYTDVIAFAQAGIENTVATCGTALGEAHFRLLSRFAQRAVLSFDSDEAGARAAERAYAFQEQYPVQAVVMIMPQGLDPADFVAKDGADGGARGRQAARARWWSTWSAARWAATTCPPSRARPAAVNDVLPILEKLHDPVRRSEYGHLLADLAGVTESSVMQALERPPGRPPAAEVEAPAEACSAQDKVEREMLKFLARDAERYRGVTSPRLDRGALPQRREPRAVRGAPRRRTATPPRSRAATIRSSRPRCRSSPWSRSTASPRPSTRERLGAPGGVPAEDASATPCGCACRS